MKEKYIPFLFLLPALLYVAYFSFYPTASAVYQSFQTPHAHFVLSNYKGLLYFGLSEAILNTLFLSAGALAIQFAVAFVVSSVLIREFRGKSVFTALFVIPFGVATVVAGFSFSNIFATTGGYANSLLRIFGLPPLNWYSSWGMDMLTIMVSDSWKNTPIVALILLAGMTSISPEIYKAAALDGAGPLRRFIHITLPNLKGYIAIALVIRGVSEFNIFALPLILVGYRPVFLTTMTYEFYSTTASVYYSYAAATVLLAFVLAFSLLVIKMRENH